MTSNEEDFDQWATQFLTDLTVRETIVKAIFDCKDKLISILKTNSLPKPFEKYTLPFLNNILPDAVSTVLKSPSLERKTFSDYFDFLQTAALIIPIAFERDELRICTNIKQIFNPQSSFYTKNHGYKSNKEAKNKIPLSYEQLVKKITNKQMFTVMNLRLMKTETVSLQHFSVFFEFFSRISESMERELSINTAILSFEAFTMFLSSDDTISSKNFDNKTLDSTLNFVFTLMQKYKQQSDILIHCLLDTAEKCILADIFDRQLYGVNLLVKFSESKLSFVKESLESYIEKGDLLSKVLSRDTHPEILNRLSPIITLVSNKKSLSKEKLMQLWETAKRSHHSQRATILPIIQHVLVTFSNDVINDFIEDAMFDLQNDTLKMLFGIANELAFNKKELSCQLFTRIINLSEDKSLNHLILTAYNDIYLDFSAYSMSIIISISHNLMKQKKCSFVPFIKPLISKVGNAKKEFSQNYINDLVELIFYDENKDIIMPLYAELAIATNTQIGTDVIESLLLSSDKKSVWTFFTLLLTKLGTATFSSDGIKCFSSFFFANFDPTKDATPEFISFMKLFLIAINIRDSKIVSNESKKASKTQIPKAYSVRDFPIECDSVLYKIMSLGSDKNAESACNLLKDIYKNTDSQNYSRLASMIISRFNSAINAKDVHGASYVAYFASLVCKEIEKDRLIEYGFISHIKAYDEGENYITIRFRNNKEKYIIYQKRSGTCKELYSLVQKIISNPKDISISAKNEHIPKNGKLCDTKIKNGGTITVTCNSGKSNRQQSTLPTICLWQNDFASMLINAIKASKNQREIYHLYIELINLPTSLQTMERMEDMKKFIEDILETNKLCQRSPGYILLFRYYIQALTIHADEFIEEFIKAKGIDILSQMFSKENPLMLNGTKEISKILQIIKIEHLKGKEDKLIPIILGFYSRDKFAEKSKPVLAELLSVISKEVPEIAQKEAFENTEGFICAVQNVSKECWPFIKSFALSLPDHKKVFQFAKEQIEEGHTRFIEIYSEYALSEINDDSIDEEIEKCLNYINNKQTSDVILALLEVVAKTIGKSNNKEKVSSKLLDFALKSNNGRINQKIYTIVGCEANEPLRKFFGEICRTKTSRFNYRPEENVRSPLGYVGLRNLGATCYVDSVLQQLFHTGPFISKFLSMEFDDDANKLLQNLFARMAISYQACCDTEPFLSVWKGWGNVPIVRYEQQDAVEFLQLVLDKMDNEASNVFKGEFINIIDDGADFRSETKEDFYSVCLTVKSFHNIDESIDGFLQEEHFEYNVENRGVVDVSKRIRINKAPKVLVVQLKRFEYDFETFDRVKIQDRFEFPNRLNIKKLLLNQEDKYYNLHGVVLHSGVAQSGHYQSLVKKENEWIMFNDSEVSECIEFEDATFGGQGKLNAYLLVYISEEEEADVKTRDYINNETLQEIEEENSMFENMSCAFSFSVFEFAVNAMNAVELTKYFFSVFCHTTLETYTDNITKRIIQLVEDVETRKEVVEALMSDFAIVEDVLINCSYQKMIDSVTQIINKLTEDIGEELAIPLCLLFIDVLYKLEATYKQILFCSTIILNIVKMYPKKCIEAGCVPKIFNFVMMSSTNETKTMFSQNVNMSPLFGALACFAVNGCDTTQFRTIIEHAKRIVVSKSQTAAFFKMTATLSGMNVLPLEDVLSLIEIDDNTPEEQQIDTIISIITGLTNERAVGECINKGINKFGNQKIIDSFVKRVGKDKTLRKQILKFPEVLLIDFIISTVRPVSVNAENLVVHLFPGAKPLKEMPKLSISFATKIELAPETEDFPTDEQREEIEELLQKFIPVSKNLCAYEPKDASFASFTRVLRFLIQYVDRTEELFKDLKDFFNKSLTVDDSSSYEVMNTVAMFNNDEAFNIVSKSVEESLSKSCRSLKDLRHQLPSIFSVIFNFCNENLIKILENPVFETVFQTLNTSESKEDIANVVEALERITKIDDCDIKFKLIDAIYFGEENNTSMIKHFISTSQFFPDALISFLDERRFTRLNKNIDELSKMSQNTSRIEEKLEEHAKICEIFTKSDISEGINIRNLLVFGAKMEKESTTKPIIDLIITKSKESSSFLENALKVATNFKNVKITKGMGTAWFVAVLRCKLCTINREFGFAQILNDAIKQHNNSRLKTSPKEVYKHWTEDEDCREGCILAVPELFLQTKLEYKYERKFFKMFLPEVRAKDIEEQFITLCKVSKFDPKKNISQEYITNMRKAYFIAKSHHELVRKVKEFTPNNEMMEKIEKNEKLAKYICIIFE